MRNAFLLILLCFTCLLGACGQEEKVAPITKENYLLNTIVSITVYKEEEVPYIEECFALCTEYENIFSRTLEGSELYKINQASKNAASPFSIQVSDDLAALIKTGLHFGEISKGALDLSIEPLSSLWDFTSDKEKMVPEDSMLKNVLPKINYQDMILKGNTLTFQQAGMGIDLGSIAKGYIADRVKEYLKSKGVESAVINLGGNVLCLGEKPGGVPFQIGIEKPFSDRKETAAILDITDFSVVSSGIYERYFEKDGVLYHHILDPKTGYPKDSDLVSVTILSKSSEEGDCLSTACLSLGLEEGMKLIHSLPDIFAVFITKDGKLHYSDGVQSAFNIREL